MKKDIDRIGNLGLNFTRKAKFPRVNYFHKVDITAGPIFSFEQAKVGVDI